METIKSSKEVKNLLEHIKELMESPEMFLVIVIIGCTIKVVIPDKINVLISRIKAEYLSLIGGLIDLILIFLFIICSILFILHFLSVFAYGLSNYILQRTRMNNFRISELLYRGNRGSHIRILLVSRWLFIMIGLLFIFNDYQFYEYFNDIKNSYLNFEGSIFMSLFGMFISIVLIQCVWFSISSIYYKYIDLYSIKDLSIEKH